jgi:hypothetical protein
MLFLEMTAEGCTLILSLQPRACRPFAQVLIMCMNANSLHKLMDDTKKPGGQCMTALKLLTGCDGSPFPMKCARPDEPCDDGANRPLARLVYLCDEDDLSRSPSKSAKVSGLFYNQSVNASFREDVGRQFARRCVRNAPDAAAAAAAADGDAATADSDDNADDFDDDDGRSSSDSASSIGEDIPDEDQLSEDREQREFVKALDSTMSLPDVGDYVSHMRSARSAVYEGPPLFVNSMPALTLENNDASTPVCKQRCVCEHRAPAHPCAT